MQKIIILGLVFIFNACNTQHHISDPAPTTECGFSYEDLEECIHKNAHGLVKIVIVTEDLGSDEKLIKALTVVSSHGNQTLVVSPDISILAGDMGYVLFPDINFDSNPDLAVTTSFGTPNLYLDYWVFDPTQQKYIFVGNYPKFDIDTKTKTLGATIKDSAEQYQTIDWKWNGNSLKRMNP